MTIFYTNVQCFGNNILYRGIENGKRIKEKLQYQPTLYEMVRKETPFKTLNGEYLHEFKFNSIREARDYLKQNEGVTNKKIYGNTRFEYNYISEQHPNEVDWDQSYLQIAIIDIEVGSENGFPDPYEASEPITAIAVKYLGGKTYVWGCGDFENTDENVTYFKCRDEYTLSKKFLEFWTKNYPDIVTGWNIKFFDFPYLVNRFNRILSEQDAKSLSPWNYVSERTAILMAKAHIVYEFVGLPMLDYIELYRKYAPGGASQESYRLDNIAHVELDKRKVDYSEYENLHQLYKLNYQKFIEYNIGDVSLIEELEDKLKLIELALTLAYDSKTNYDDVFTQVRMWDTIIYNFLRRDNIIVPPTEKKSKSEAFEGAYVKEPQVGKHDWVASFDLNSLYPHLIMQYNLSPEMLVDPDDYTDEMSRIINSRVSVDKLLKKEIDTTGLNNVTLTPNGQFFRTDKQGFLPKLMAEMYEDRKKYKKKSLEAKQELENEKNKSKHFEIQKRIARFNNLQLAKKVCLNSAYGAMGNEYFRFYDLRIALAVTSAGQFSIRWIENKLNEYMNKLIKTEGVDYVIASDTDSIYLKLGSLVGKVFQPLQSPDKVIAFMDKVCEDKIQPYIDKSYQELADYVHAYDQKMQMKREALANKAIWTAKKRYIMNVYNNEGVQYAEPDLKVMGLEMVKSSTPAPIREKMEETIKLMMNGTEEDVQKFVANFKEEFKKFSPEEISFPRGIRGIKKYSDSVTLYTKGTPIHVKGAIIYNNALKQKGLDKKYPLINDGEKIKFSYLKTPNPFKESVISFPVTLPKEFDLQKYIDYDMQFEKAFVEPIKVVLDCMNWNIEKQSTLEDFFG
jgi:DNA polymerase elongation subunit (family B)